MSAQSYNTWFVPAEFLKADAHAVYMTVPNGFFQDWLNDHIDVIEAAARPLGFTGLQFVFIATRDRDPIPEPPRLHPVDLFDFLKMELPPQKLLLDPILSTRSAAMLYSKRGAGKTFLSLAIGCAVAAGQPILRWAPPEPRKVLYVDGEMPAAGMQVRLKQILKGMPAQPAPGYFRLITPDLEEFGIWSLSRTEGQVYVEDQLADTNLLILDNLSTLCRGGRENDAESWGQIQEWVLRLRRAGLCVLMIHHAGRNGEQRGTSMREDTLETMITLRHPDDYRPRDGVRVEVHFPKVRNIYGDAAEPFEVRMQSEKGAIHWSMATVGDPTKAKAADLLEEGKTVRQVAEELNISRSAAGRLKKKIDDETK